MKFHWIVLCYNENKIVNGLQFEKILFLNWFITLKSDSQIVEPWLASKFLNKVVFSKKEIFNESLTYFIIDI